MPRYKEVYRTVELFVWKIRPISERIKQLFNYVFLIKYTTRFSFSLLPFFFFFYVWLKLDVYPFFHMTSQVKQGPEMNSLHM